MTTYDDMTKVGAEVKAKGFRCLKTNIAIEIDGKITAYRPGFVVGRGFPERNWDEFIARSAAKTVEAFRKGCGPDVGIMLDTNFHFRTEGFRRIAEAVGPDPAHLARARCARSEVDRPDPPRFAGARSPRARRCSSAATSGPISRPMPSTPRSSTWCGTASTNR